MLSLLASVSHAQTVTVTRTIGFDYDSYGKVSRQTIEPDDTTLAYKVVTDYGTNAYGSVTSQTISWQDPNLGPQTRAVQTIVYDARSRFSATVTNAKNQFETRVNDDAYGNLTSLTDLNQLVTTWQYDGWGRKTRETRADTTATSWSYRKCVDSCASGAATVAITQNWAGASQTTVPNEDFTDMAGRTVRSRTWGFDGTAILTDRTYDASARLYQTARPRFASASAVLTTFLHDAIGRTTQVQAPASTGSGVDTTVTLYNGLSVTTTNSKSQARTEVRNGLGLLKSVTDAYAKTTTYLYDPWGNLTRTTDPLLNQINVAYDRLGRKTQLADPNLGTWNYLVDPLGLTWQQTDAKQQATTFTFDVLRRMTRRFEPDLDSHWDYDTATTGVGKLAEAFTLTGLGAKDYRRIYTYDSLGRTSTVTTSLDWDYVTESAYDTFGRPFQNQRRNPKGGSGGASTAIYKLYNAQGYPFQTWRYNDGVNTLMAQVAVVDAEGHVKLETFGAAGALQTGRTYNAFTGRLETVSSGLGNGSGGVTASLQNDTYTYDSLGNPLTRSQLISTSGALMSETIGYDNLNRVTSSLVWGQSTQVTGYDALGNVTGKANVGTYIYQPSGGGSTRPNAVASISGTVAGIVNPAFNYDANGNTLTGLVRTTIWTSFNQPASIDKLSGASAVQRTAFLYSPEHQRTSQTISPMSGGVPGAATTTIYYAGPIEKEIDFVANTTTIRTYAMDGIGYVEEKMTGTSMAATASATRNARFFLQDHLGSPIVVADESSAVLQRMSYDPWGRRRNADGTDDSWGTLGTIANGQDHSGYTGQEQLDKLGLVNLNGRVYDPIIGRMLSADPTIPDAHDTQALNRYSYVLNNPLAYTDPSGFSPSLDGVPDNFNDNEHGPWRVPGGQCYSVINCTPGGSWLPGVGSADFGGGGDAAGTGKKGDVAWSDTKLVGEPSVMPDGSLLLETREITGHRSTFWENFTGPDYSGASDDFLQRNLQSSGAARTEWSYRRESRGQTPYSLHQGLGDLANLTAAILPGPVGAGARLWGAANGIANPVSGTLARVVPGNIKPTTLGKAGDLDVFVTNASELRGLSAKQIAEKLSIPLSSSFRVIEFPSGSGIASLIGRTNPGFVGGGRTAGGASEFVIPNGPIPAGAVDRIVH